MLSKNATKELDFFLSMQKKKKNRIKNIRVDLALKSNILKTRYKQEPSQSQDLYKICLQYFFTIFYYNKLYFYYCILYSVAKKN